MTDYKTITIEWADHFYVEGPLVLKEVIQRAQKIPVRETTGKLVHESKRILVVAPTVDDDDDSTEFEAVYFIMKRSIISRSDVD